MTWLYFVLGLAIVGILLWWWLSRPLWYQSRGVRELESFLRDLVAPRNPWPCLYVTGRDGKDEVVFSRRRVEGKGFALELQLSIKQPKASSPSSLRKALIASHFDPNRIFVTADTDDPRLSLDFGVADSSTLSEATQACRIILGELDVPEDAALRVRYGGMMDSRVAGPAIKNAEQQGGHVARVLARAGLKYLRRR